MLALSVNFDFWASLTGCIACDLPVWFLRPLLDHQCSGKQHLRVWWRFSSPIVLSACDTTIYCCSPVNNTFLQTLFRSMKLFFFNKLSYKMNLYLEKFGTHKENLGHSCYFSYSNNRCNNVLGWSSRCLTWFMQILNLEPDVIQAIRLNSSVTNMSS